MSATARIFDMTRRPRNSPTAVLIAFGLTACSGSAPVLERLDERAGLTLARAREPLVFARTEPRYSRSARDYLYVGPIETNRQGVREYFLWVGVATTLDRGFIAPATDLPTSLYVTVDDEPMELPLQPFGELVRRTTDAAIYATVVPLSGELAARVTLQQLELLDAAGLASVAVSASVGGPLRSYTRWDRGGNFGDFVASRKEP
jgi:hypothetical protein